MSRNGVRDAMILNIPDIIPWPYHKRRFTKLQTPYGFQVKLFDVLIGSRVADTNDFIVTVYKEGLGVFIAAHSLSRGKLED